jgi:ligand-binding SRPBCC domain-containing protein
MSGPATITVTSRVPADAQRVWAHACTMAGVNDELAPFVRMTVPAAARGLAIDEAPLGEVAFRSVLLALGVVPFDRHDLRLAAVVPGCGFQERSTSLLQRRWDHDRTLTPVGAETIVTDRVTFAPRIGGARLAAPMVRALFRHRHRRLRRILAPAHGR